MFRCYSYTIIRERINLCLCSHTTTMLTTHRCILMDYFNNCNFSEHKLMRSLIMV